MSKINSPPVGLQSLLGSKNFGENPDDLLREVRPTVDMLPFWGSQRLRFDQTVAIQAGVGSMVERQIPLGESWLVLSASITILNLASGAENGLAIHLDDSLVGTISFRVAYQWSGTNPQPANQESSCIWQPPIPYLLAGGSVIRGWNAGINPAQSGSWQLDIVHYRLEI